MNSLRATQICFKVTKSMLRMQSVSILPQTSNVKLYALSLLVYTIQYSLDMQVAFGQHLHHYQKTKFLTLHLVTLNSVLQI